MPENRKQYGFDNIGFKATSNEIEPIGHYRVFRKTLPDIYNITGITVGLNAGGNIKWSYKFRTEKKYDD